MCNNKNVKSCHAPNKTELHFDGFTHWLHHKAITDLSAWVSPITYMLICQQQCALSKGWSLFQRLSPQVEMCVIWMHSCNKCNIHVWLLFLLFNIALYYCTIYKCYVIGACRVVTRVNVGYYSICLNKQCWPITWWYLT